MYRLKDVFATFWHKIVSHTVVCHLLVADGEDRRQAGVLLNERRRSILNSLKNGSLSVGQLMEEAADLPDSCEDVVLFCVTRYFQCTTTKGPTSTAAGASSF